MLDTNDTLTKGNALKLRVTKYKDTNVKRFKPTDCVENVYYDEVDFPAFGKRRNVETHKGYKEYCQLWREFIELQTVVLWRNKPTDKTIPRIQSLIDELEMKRELDDKNNKKPLNEKDKSKLDEYNEYMKTHIFLWAQMNETIEALSKNEYVKGRNQNDSFNINNYKMSLYDMINK